MPNDLQCGAVDEFWCCMYVAVDSGTLTKVCLLSVQHFMIMMMIHHVLASSSYTLNSCLRILRKLLTIQVPKEIKHSECQSYYWHGHGKFSYTASYHWSTLSSIAYSDGEHFFKVRCFLSVPWEHFSEGARDNLGSFLCWPCALAFCSSPYTKEQGL